MRGISSLRWESRVSFGKALSSPSNASLREKIMALGEAGLSQSLHCETVLGLFEAPPSSISDRRGLFLLLDYHRLLLYDDSDNSVPGMDSVLCWLIDDYPNQPFDLFAAHAKSHPFHFLYELDALDLLAALWRHVHPGIILAADFVTGEIRMSKPQFHPAVQSLQQRTASSQGCLNTLPVAFALRDRIVGPGLRIGEPPELGDLISLDSGIIRNEHITIRDTIIPTVVGRISTDHGASQTISGGKDFYLPSAVAVARLEAVERYHLLFPNPSEPHIYASYSSLSGKAVDPRALCFNVVAWSGEQENSRWVKYTDSSLMYWVWAEDVLTREQKLVPAQEVYMNPLAPGDQPYVPTTTSACALGSCAEEAALFAIFEAVERDAYLTTWYTRRCCQKIVPASIRFEPFQLLWARIRSVFPHYTVHLLDIGADIALPTVAAVAVKTSGTGPRTVHAAATRLRAEQALFKVLVDIAGELEHGLRTKPRRRLLDEPELVAAPEDHRDLYALDEVFERLSFLDFDKAPTMHAVDLDMNAIIKPQYSYNMITVLEHILAHCKAKGITVLLKDITQPLFATRGIHCARAIALGLYPMWFGYHNRRFVLTDRLRALSLRFTGSKLMSEADVNLKIHPFS